MSASSSAGFAQFVPGFDFLQNLAKSATQAVPQMPNMANWIAPTLNVEELEKRIAELKTVLFWLEQNAKALSATVQALEVQKMTLATLKGMNLNMADLANSFKVKPPEPEVTPMQQAADATARQMADALAQGGQMAEGLGQAAKPMAEAAAASLVDPMLMWNSLSQQFQQIAVSAMEEVGKASAVETKPKPAKAAKTANAAAKAADKPVVQAKAVKTPAKKAAAKAPRQAASK